MNSADFARLFDAQNRDFTDDIPLWSALAERYGDPVLELGCGAGRVLLPLAAAGHRITGIDNNRHMLQRLANRVPAALESLVTLQAMDLTDLDLNERFSLILAPCNTLASLPDPNFMRLLVQLRSQLAASGAFACELPPPGTAQSSVDPDEIIDRFHEPDHGVDVQVSASQISDPAGSTATVEWRYDEMGTDGEVARLTRTSAYYLRDPSDLSRLLSGAGFARPQFFGDYQFGAFSEESEILLVLAERTPS